jgi:hypothetical protein
MVRVGGHKKEKPARENKEKTTKKQVEIEAALSREPRRDAHEARRPLSA